MTYDQYGYAFAALFGTGLAGFLIMRLILRTPLGEALRRFKGVEPQVIGVIGMLFALTLAFLANDSWQARDRASTAVFQEADALRGIRALAVALPPTLRSPLESTLNGYIRQTVSSEWPLLAQRRSDPLAGEALDRLLEQAASPVTAQILGTSVQGQLLSLIMQVRANRDQRLALSQTHINPGKWLNMAGLGFLCLLVTAIVHIEKPRAAQTAILLFALAAGPMAAVVLVQSNPFQAPAAISAEPLRQVSPALFPTAGPGAVPPAG